MINLIKGNTWNNLRRDHALKLNEDVNRQQNPDFDQLKNIHKNMRTNLYQIIFLMRWVQKVLCK